VVILATITIRVEDEVKKQAEEVLGDIGINVTTLFNACLKALVREKKVPFDLVSSEYMHRKMINEKLEESLLVASDTSSKRYTHDEVFKPLRAKYDYEVQD